MRKIGYLIEHIDYDKHLIYPLSTDLIKIFRRIFPKKKVINNNKTSEVRDKHWWYFDKKEYLIDSLFYLKHFNIVFSKIPLGTEFLLVTKKI